MDYNQEVFVIKDFLSEDEIKELKDSINKQRSGQVEHIPSEIFKHWSRINAQIDIIPESVFKKFQNVAHQYGSPNLEFTHQTTFRYEKQFGGTTQCPPHMDGHSTQFSMDYQVDANVEWALYVEGKKYVLQNNDVLIMSGRSQVHWREDKTLNDEEYCDMFIMHFAEPEYIKKQELGLIKNSPVENLEKAQKSYNQKYYENLCVSTDQFDHSKCNHQ
jgi:hypothetical protein